QGIPRDTCSTAVELRAEDAFGNGVALQAAAQVDLTVMGVPVTFHPAQGCAGQPITQVALPAAAGSVATFYFKGGMAVGTATVRAGIAGNPLAPATQDETIGAGPPHHLTFTTPPRSITAGGCSPLVTVQLQDDGGIGTNPVMPVAVTLEGAPDAGFGVFTNASCTTPLGGPLMVMGTPSASFYFSATQTPSVTVSATTGSAGIGAAAPQVHPVGPAGPARLVFSTPPQSIAAGTCSAPARVDVLDTHGNLTRSVGLTLSFNAAAPQFTFHGPNDCSGAAPASTDGGTGFDFRFRGLRTGPVDVTVSAGALMPATQREFIDAGSPQALAFTTQPRTQTAGACSMTPLAVAVEDAFGNVVASPGTLVTLTSDAGYRFFGDGGCTGAEAGQVMVVGTTAPLWFDGTIAGTRPITATSGALTPAVQQETIVAATASQLHIVRPTPATQVAVCSAQPVTVQTRDAFGNVSSVTNGLTVAIDGGTAVTAYDAAMCGSAVAGVQVPANMSQATFYFRGATAGLHPVLVSAQGFSDDVHPLEVTPGPTALGLQGVPALYYAGQCVPITVRTEDGMGNARVTGLDLAVGVGTERGVTWYSESTCTTQTSSLTVPAGQSTAVGYVRAITGGSFNLGANAVGVSAASVPITVMPAVRRGTCLIDNNDSTSTEGAGCPISPPLLSLERSFLVFQSEVPGGSASNDVVARCHLTSTSALECTRNGSPNNELRLHWQIATLPTTVTVQHLTSGCVNNGETISVASISNLGEAFVLHSVSTGGNLDDNEHDTVELSATAVTPLHAGAQCNTHDVQVVRYTGASVTRGTSTLNAGVLAQAVPLVVSSTSGRAFPIYSWRTASTGGDACERNLRATLDGGSLSLTRGNGAGANPCADNAFMSVAYERVELPSGSVQSVELAMPNGTSRTSQDLATAVDPTRTLVITGSNTWGGSGLGETNQTDDDDPDNFAGRFALDGGSQVLGARVATNDAVRYTVYVIELDPR
ncbi:MAG: hypothetical protein JNK82_20530, partial [Myxococcaceae bacterium]|nr:hypothetical protein [Myxococcaceae bacterium]